jgi:hypothetical protein
MDLFNGKFVCVDSRLCVRLLSGAEPTLLADAHDTDYDAVYAVVQAAAIFSGESAWASKRAGSASTIRILIRAILPHSSAVP